MSEFVSKEALIESFQEIVSEMQDTITEMTKNQSFLNIFEDHYAKASKKITDNDANYVYPVPDFYKNCFQHS